MENKNLTTSLLIGAGVLLLVGSAYYMFANNKPNPTKVMQEKVAEEIKKEEMEENNPASANEDEVVYKIIEGSNASYIVTKKYILKDPITVKGTSNMVTGSGKFNKESGQFELTAQVDLLALGSDSAQRDTDLQKRFTNKYAIVEIKGTDKDILNAEKTVSMPVDITVNDVKKTYAFDVTIIPNKDKFIAKGVTNMKVSDFKIELPQIKGVYEVLDDGKFEFEINAEKVMN